MSEEFEIWMFGKVEDGKLMGIPKKKLAQQLKHFEGKSIELTIRKKKKYRSIQQNRVWWMYMNILSDELGYDKDTMHEICKMKFLKSEAVNEKTEEVYQYVKSTSALSTTEFQDLFQSLYAWASETFGIVLPEPNTQIEMQLNEQ